MTARRRRPIVDPTSERAWRCWVTGCRIRGEWQREEYRGQADAHLRLHRDENGHTPPGINPRDYPGGPP